LVDYRDGRSVRVGLHAGEDEIWPPVVFVIVAASAVGDAVSYYGEGAVVLRGIYLDGRQEVPV
jgi:hypothetical protein